MLVFWRDEWRQFYSLAKFGRQCSIFSVVGFFGRWQEFDVRVAMVAAAPGLRFAEAAAFDFGTYMFGFVQLFLCWFHSILLLAICVGVLGSFLRKLVLWPGGLCSGMCVELVLMLVSMAL